MTKERIPTLIEWVGGGERVEELITRFYEHVAKDPLLRPLFEHMDTAHAKHVAAFITEVFGGPATYSQEHGGHPKMIRKHLGKAITEEQRKRWVALLLETADEVGIPDDPEFRSAFVSYLEWGSRLAVINSQPGAEVEENVPMPEWGWGEAGGPYIEP